MANEVRLIDANALNKILEEAQDGTRRIYSSLVDYRDKEVCKGELGTYARVKRMVEDAPAVDAVERKKLIKKMFPMGVPNTREEWNYSINARAVYEAIMKTEE